MKISDLYASAWDNAISETAYFVNKLDKSPNTYTKNDWILLEPFAIANQLEFDEDGFLIEAPDEPVEGCDDIEASSEDEELAEVYRIAPSPYDLITDTLDAAGCWYQYDEDWDRIMLLEDGLAALDAAGIEYTEV